MTPLWDHATEAFAWLRGRRTAGELLVLLHRLRFAERTLVGPLLGVSASAAAVQAAALLERRLLGGLHASTGPERAPGLLHLTDLGLGVLALAWGADPRRLAADAHLRGRDVVASAAALPGGLEVRRLLARLAGSHPGRVVVRDFREPFVLPPARGRGRVSVPSYASLAWGGEAAAPVHGYLVVPDDPSVGDAERRRLVRRLSERHDDRGGAFPLLVVGAPTPERLARWEEWLADPRPALRAPSLPWMPILLGPAPETTPDAAPRPPARGDRPVWGPGQPIGPVPERRPSPARARLRPVPRPGKALPRPVGDLPGPRPPEGTPLRRRVGHALLSLTAAPVRLLDWIGPWPFADEADLARLAGFRTRVARAHRTRLVELGLVRLLERWEVKDLPADAPLPPLAEATVLGAAVIAAYHRLPRWRAKARLGLSGGGPAHRFGQRQRLLQHLGHTRAVVAVVAAFAEALRAEAGVGTELLECRPPSACGDALFRPDAHVVFRRRGVLREYLLEFEHGTARGERGYPRKFAQYHRYYGAHHLGADGRYHGPTVLVVVDHHADPRWAREHTPAYRREHNWMLLDRIAAGARAADAVAGRPLDVRMTTLLQAAADCAGLAGPVWAGSHDPAPSCLPLPPVNLRPLLAGREEQPTAPTPCDGLQRPSYPEGTIAEAAAGAGGEGA